MKAWIGSLLLGVTANAAWAQSPAFQRVTPSIPTVVMPLPSMPDLPSVTQRSGAQLPSAAIAMPPPPIAGQSAGEPGGFPKFNPVDLSTGYGEPFIPPESEPTIIEDQPLTLGGTAGPRFWMTADYLFWWTKRAPQRDPLVVTGPATDPFPGALDQPNTRVLFGGNGFDFNPFSGIRANLGVWFGPDNRLGFELGGFILEQKSVQYRAGGDAFGQPFLARPFTNARTGNENVYFISQNFADPARTALMTGGIDVSANSKLWSYEANGLYNSSRGENLSVNFIGGFRSVVLREKLTISESVRNLLPAGGVTYLGQPLNPAFRELTIDQYDTENSFFGGQLGTRLHFQAGRLGIDLTGKAAIGWMQQVVNLQGITAIDGPNSRVALIAPGGVYAVGPTLGRHHRQVLGIVPEGNIDLSYALTDSVIVKTGYSFLFLNRVARPGNQINRNLNPGLVPSDPEFNTPGGPIAPTLPFQSSSFWAQGVNLALEIRY